jgi:hypothetical protein
LISILTKAGRLRNIMRIAAPEESALERDSSLLEIIMQ